MPRFLISTAALTLLVSMTLSGFCAQAPADKEITNSFGMKLILIPKGSFVMGSPGKEKEHLNEEVEHSVSISGGFYMGVYEVTQAQYEKVMGKNPSHFSPAGAGKSLVKDLPTGDFPVENINWDDADAFCKKLSELDKERRYDLPTEAEWEYACRAGSKTVFNVGLTMTSAQANFNGVWPLFGSDPSPKLGRTAKVGSYKPNDWGLYDMHGNVWEWVKDWYDEDYYKKSPKLDPPGPAAGEMRILRGGSWINRGAQCRCAYRYAFEPDGRHNGYGLRVVARAK